MKASEDLSEKDVTHISFVLDNTSRTFKTIGDDVSAKLFDDNKDLMTTIENTLEESRNTKKVNKTKIKTTSKVKLFANPRSKQWKGAMQIRSALSDIMGDLGYGHNKALQYGKGPAPANWPDQYDWSSFTRPSRTSVKMCTNIIVALHGSEEVDQEGQEEQVDQVDLVDQEGQVDQVDQVDPADPAEQVDQEGQGGQVEQAAGEGLEDEVVDEDVN